MSDEKKPFSFREKLGVFGSNKKYQSSYTGGPAGPFLSFRGSVQDDLLSYSVLSVLPDYVEGLPKIDFSPFFLQVSTDAQNSRSEEACEPERVVQEGSVVLLDTINGFNFWRHILLVRQHATIDLSVRYKVSSLPPAVFVAPSLATHWRLAFYSCNGYSSDVGPDRVERYKRSSPLWNDLLKESNHGHLHLLVGGGDQLYFDGVWKLLPELTKWASQKDKNKRMADEFTMREETTLFYLDTYLIGFSATGFRDILASVPSAMSWDDHDIFDGWGSYPLYLHDSAVFKGVFSCALRLYLLFQQHTNRELASADGMFGASGGFSRLLQCGPELALALPDTRTERSLRQVLDPDSWSQMFDRISKLRPSTRHLMFLAPVPIVYPHANSAGTVRVAARGFSMANKVMGSFESLLSCRSDGGSILSGTALFRKAVNVFNEPELLDDLMDHWTAAPHADERFEVLTAMQAAAEKQKLRISILSGDVHLAAAGVIYANEAPKNSAAVDAEAAGTVVKPDEMLLANVQALKNSAALAFLKKPMREDPCVIFQFVTSAICNLPPPNIVVTSLMNTTMERRVNMASCERMLDVFDRSAEGEASKGDSAFFMRRRNWCLVEMKDSNAIFSICVEKEKGNLSGETTRFAVHVDDLFR